MQPRASVSTVVALVLAFAPAAARAQAIHPGDDFYAYANAAWLKTASIPAGKERWGARDEINDVTRQRIITLLEDARAKPASALARKVSGFYNAWLNESAIEAKGLAPLRPALDSIVNMHDKVALSRLLGRAVRADVDPLNWGIYRSAHLIGLSVEESIHGEKNNVAFLLQGGLGLPDRENYVSAEPRLVAIRAAYQQYIARTLSLAGFDHAE